jgi:hypothetical protein
MLKLRDLSWVGSISFWRRFPSGCFYTQCVSLIIVRSTRKYEMLCVRPICQVLYHLMSPPGMWRFPYHWSSIQSSSLRDIKVSYSTLRSFATLTQIKCHGGNVLESSFKRYCSKVPYYKKNCGNISNSRFNAGKKIKRKGYFSRSVKVLS